MKSMPGYRGYVFTVHCEPREPADSVRFVDMREISTSGRTLDDALHNACESLDLHLECLDKINQRAPMPRHRLVVQTTGS